MRETVVRSENLEGRPKARTTCFKALAAGRREQRTNDWTQLGHRIMALVKSVLVLVCMPVLGAVAFYPAVSTHTLASVPKARCAAAAAPAPLKLRMRDTWKRIGSLAKDKLGGAKDWVDSGAKPERDMNVRGAATGAVVGVRSPAPHQTLIFHDVSQAQREDSLLARLSASSFLLTASCCKALDHLCAQAARMLS